LTGAIRVEDHVPKPAKKGRSALGLRTIAAAAIVASLVAAPAAHAARWTQVTTPDGGGTDQVGIARTADGTLHVAWHHPTGGLSADLLHTAITPGGKIGAASPIATGWIGFEDPAIIAVPGGLRVFAGAMRSTDSADPSVGLITFSSSDGGATWLLQNGSIALGGQAYGSDVAATTLPDGATLQAWAGTLGTWVHAGLTPATPNHDFQAPLGQYGYQPGLDTSAASGRTVMAWYSNADGRLGVFAQSVAPDGSPIGAPASMPGTGNMSVGTVARTAIAARPGGGFYVAYPTGYPSLNRVRVWRVGAANAPVLARTTGHGNQPVTVAAAPDGRLWVAWADQRSFGTRVLVRRSNRKAPRFGATVFAGSPKGAPDTYSLDASAAPDGGLDLLGTFGIGTTSNAATYYRRVRPGLSLAARPVELRRGERTRILFKVTDAGDPVKGARVHAGGESGVTDGKGRITLTVRAAGSRLLAKASHSGYVPAKRRLRARR
jgi:hypothetical protein